jgi:hypothetical protein
MDFANGTSLGADSPKVLLHYAPLFFASNVMINYNMVQTRDQPNEKNKIKCKNEQRCLSVGYLTRHKKSAGFWKGVTPIEVGVLSFEKIPSFF